MAAMLINRLKILLFVLFIPLQTQASQLINFLSLADIHFDPYMNCVKHKPCPFIDSLRNSPVEQWSALFTKFDQSLPQYKKDTNYRLLISALSEAKKIVQDKQIKFIIILGDSLCHSFKENYKLYSQDKTLRDYHRFHQKTFQFLALILAQAFPNIDIYSVIGNNDSFNGDYYSVPNARFFHDTGILWSQLIKSPTNRQKMQSDFNKYGYYTVVLPEVANLRLIILNTNLFSSKARGLPNAMNFAATQQLNWLNRQLQSAKLSKQKVFILMHIPETLDIYLLSHFRLFTLLKLWKPAYTIRFKNLLTEFSPEITGIFTGHIHTDWFQYLTINDSTKIPLSGTPSISPIFGNNPGLKVYTIDSFTLKLADYVTYYYPLSSSNFLSIGYDYNCTYQLNCNECPMRQSKKFIHSMQSLANYVQTLFKIKPVANMQNWEAYYWCSFNEGDMTAANFCGA